MPSQDNSEQIHRQMAESAMTMVSTDYWKLLTKVLVNDEMNLLVRLENYLAEGAPDRDKAMMLCALWYAQRRQRRLLLANAYEARLKYAPEPPSSEEVESILKEYGEM